MDYQEKIRYIANFYLDNGLPNNISAIELFTPDIINHLDEEFSIYFYIDDFILLLKTYKDTEIPKTLASYMLKKNFGFVDGFNKIIEDEEASRILIDAIVYVLNNTKDTCKSNALASVFSSDKLTKLFLGNEITHPERLNSIFISGLPPERFAVLLNNEVFVKALLSLSISTFIYFCTKVSKVIDVKEYLNLAFAKLSYIQTIKTIEYYYKPEKGEPAFLQDLYNEFSEVINHRKIRNKIVSLPTNPTDENKEIVNNLINTPEGYEILTTEVLEPTFSEIVGILGLNNNIHKTRKEKLLERLSNYEEYEPQVVKDLLCEYCFDDISTNVILKLKTIIEYTQTNPQVVELIKDQMSYINELYKYLTSEELTQSPLDYINYLDINGIIRKMHEVFSEEVNKKSDITDILRDSPKKEVNGVSVIDVDIPLDRSYFIVHSVSANDIGDNPLETYTEYSKKKDRICTSLLDNNHTSTFLNGVVLGYCNIKAPLYSVIPGDGQTNQRVMKRGVPQYRSALSGVGRFLHRTIDKYNELTYDTGNELILPSYVLVVDREPSELDYKVASSFNIPILIYHTKKVEYEYEPVVIREPFDYSTNTIDYVKKQQSKNLSI